MDSSNITQLNAFINNPLQNTTYVIELYPIGRTSGTNVNIISLNISQNNNILILSNFRITSSGTFLICLNSSQGYRAISDKTFTVQNTVSKITLESSSQVSAFTEVTFIARIIGEDENLFIQKLFIDLYCENYRGEILASTNNGTARFKGYFYKNFTADIKVLIQGTNLKDEIIVYVINPNFTIEFEKIAPIVSFI